MAATLRTTRFLMLAAAILVAPAARAGVELIQVDATNAAQFLSEDARKLIGNGDVLLLSEFVQVAVLTTATTADPTRTGRCVVLEGPGANLRPAGIAVEPVQGIGWENPEAGVRGDVAVVRFRRGGETANAELTYRLRAASASVEIVTRIANNDPKRVLEMPIVDGVSVASSAKPTAEQGSMILVEGPAAVHAYFMANGKAQAREGRRAWHLAMIPDDPGPGTFRRVSQQILTLGRGERTFSPIQASNDWSRRFRDRDIWFRIQPGTQQTVERALLVAASRDEAIQWASVVRQGQAATIEPPRQTEAAASPSVRVRDNSPFRPASNPKIASTRIVGKLRGESEPAGQARPASLPSAVLQRSIAPPLPAHPSAAPQEEPPELAPTIDAIENLPPPEE